MAHQDVQNGVPEKAAEEVAFTALKTQLLVDAPKASDAVQFYKAAFGAVETDRSTQPKRKAGQELPHIISAQLQLAGSTILISDLTESSAPAKTAGTGITLWLETEDVEAAVAKAVAAGAVAEKDIAGDVSDYEGGCVGTVKDPYGFVWVISSPAKKTSADVEA